MKKHILSLSFASTLSFGFGLDSLSSIASNIGDSIGNINFNNDSSSISVDNQCQKQFENYDFNWSGILKVASLYGISNSEKIIGFLNNKSDSKQITSDDFKKFAKLVAKNYLWIPLEVEKIYGEEIYKNRVQGGDVILRNTKNSKYKKLYKKVDSFIAEFNKYTKQLENSYPYEIKVYILSTEKTAEAAPYGYVFISEDYVKNDTYKTILSHEMAHISKRHTTKEIQYRMVNMYDSITEVTSLIKKMQDIDMGSKFAYGYAGREVIKKSFEAYSQEQEIEADACGLKTLNSILPNKKQKIIQEFIKNIKEGYHYKENDLNKFSEHPDKEIRIDNIQKLATHL